ncbi:MAG TPA: ATP synthase subunit I [Candidatus Acidoferrum sp.]|nr:ATP synthase subunit I [Candidatus Acidoferrum sp.]
MRNDQIPTIAAIQRMNVILVAVTAIILFFFDSSAAAVGCLLGGAIVIANLWVLSILGAMILAAAGAGISSTAAKFGVMAIPLKMLIVVGLVFLVFKRTHVDGVGFAFGVLTQMTAAIIETGRASLRGSS